MTKTKIPLVSFLRTLNRSFLSRNGATEFLKLFKKHKHAIYRNLDRFEMNFAQLCFPLLYAKCRAGYFAEERPGFLLVSNERFHFVLPLTDDWNEFQQAVVDLVRKGGKVMAFPQIASMPYRPNRFPEYVGETEFVATLPGRRMKPYRNESKKLEQRGVVIEEGAERSDELLKINAAWYANFERRKGFKAERFSESKAIISLVDQEVNDKDLVRFFRVLIPENPGSSSHLTLRGFLVTCRLSETYWAGVLSRTRSDDSMVANYVWHKAARSYLAEGVPMENDNIGGIDSALCEYKARFSTGLITTYQLWSD